tara:strand:+ start:4171 stop:4548 length:378 start_codon:yes stop_codon:yes gene_type:complete
MSKNILEEIIEKKKEKINYLKKNFDVNFLHDLIKNYDKFYNFKEKIQKNISNNKFSIIAEIKKASPSAGIIIKDYDPVKIANIYDINNATCLSVLTEEQFFLGNLEHISKIKKKLICQSYAKTFL